MQARCLALGRSGGKTAELSTTTGGTHDVLSVDHETATERRRHKDVKKTSVLMPQPELHLAHGCRGGFALNVDRGIESISDQLIDAHCIPDAVVCRLAGQLGQCGFRRKRYADACELSALNAGFRKQRTDRAAKVSPYCLRLRKCNLARRTRAHIAEEIEHDDGDVVTADVEANRKAAVRIYAESDRRCATIPSNATGFENEPIFQQALCDRHDARPRQPCDQGYIRA